MFSPDERFIAYSSDESGVWEVYVQPRDYTLVAAGSSHQSGCPSFRPLAVSRRRFVPSAPIT